MTSVYRDTINKQFNGVLSAGKHKRRSGQACAIEAYSVARGFKWTDDAAKLKMPDIRRLNDAPWPSAVARTEAMVPLVEALWDWAEWAPQEQYEYMVRVLDRTIRQVVPIALRAKGFEEAALQSELTGMVTRNTSSDYLDTVMFNIARANVLMGQGFPLAADIRAAAAVITFIAQFASVSVEPPTSYSISEVAAKIWTEAGKSW